MPSSGAEGLSSKQFFKIFILEVLEPDYLCRNADPEHCCLRHNLHELLLVTVPSDSYVMFFAKYRKSRCC
jgi:hypothetical protein